MVWCKSKSMRNMIGSKMRLYLKRGYQSINQHLLNNEHKRLKSRLSFVYVLSVISLERHWTTLHFHDCVNSLAEQARDFTLVGAIWNIIIIITIIIIIIIYVYMYVFTFIYFVLWPQAKHTCKHISLTDS